MRELKMPHVSEWALHRYYNTGTRSMMLAGAGERLLGPRDRRPSFADPYAGSLYILMIIACGKLKTSILELPSNMISALHKLIRYPDGRFPAYAVEFG